LANCLIVSTDTLTFSAVCPSTKMASACFAPNSLPDLEVPA
jgi:hypothetical protein